LGSRRGSRPGSTLRTLCAVALTLVAAPRYVAGAVPYSSTHPLWSDIDVAIESADYESALALLAELSADETHRGAALSKAAEVYLQQGKEQQAVDLLEQAILLPEQTDCANLLVLLLYKRRAYGDIIRIYELHLPVVWDESVLLLVRNAFLAEIGKLPDSELHALPKQRKRALSLTYAGNAYVSEYAPYSDDTSIRDVEMHWDVSTRVTYPWRKDTDLTARLVVEDDRSQSSPESFHRYQTQFYGLHTGFHWRALDKLRVRCETGLTAIDKKEYDDADIGGQETEWTYAVSVAHSTELYDIRTGGYRTVFGSPAADDYAIEKRTAKFVGLTLRPHALVELEGGYTRLHYTGEMEDYGLLAGTLRYSPAKYPAVSLNWGAERELRDKDQDSLFAGIDRVMGLPRGTALFASLTFYANVSTSEREILVELTLARKRGSNHFVLGLSGRHEINVNERRSLQFFIRLQ